MAGAKARDFIAGERVSARISGEARGGTVVAVGHKYVHVRFDDATLRSLQPAHLQPEEA